MISIRTRHPGYAPPAEFESTMAWLAALPPRTTMVVEDETSRLPHLCSVEDLIDAIALGPVVEERMREIFGESST